MYIQTDMGKLKGTICVVQFVIIDRDDVYIKISGKEFYCLCLG